MELGKGSEETRPLRQSPSAFSDYSEGSISTVVGSPSPGYFRHGFGYEPMSSTARHERSASAARPMLGIDNIADEDPDSGSSTGGHIDATAARSGERPLRAPLAHAGTWMNDDYSTTILRDDKRFPSLKPLPKPYSNELYGISVEESLPTPASKFLSARRVQQDRRHWFSITILTLASYSTVMSGLWLGVATIRPAWGHRISSSSGITPSNASLACALLAKSIELSFVTAFVAFLGQKLSRRAFFRPSTGISIAEMSMRTWVMQPGTMLTHWESVQSAALSWLGALTFFVAWLAVLYTSASDALGTYHF